MNLLVNALLTTIIFILLSPGVLLSLPDKSLENGFGVANVSEIVVHGMLFFFIYYAIKYSVWWYRDSENAQKNLTSVSRSTPTLASIASPPSISIPKTVSSSVST